LCGQQRALANRPNALRGVERLQHSVTAGTRKLQENDNRCCALRATCMAVQANTVTLIERLDIAFSIECVGMKNRLQSCLYRPLTPEG
jgi:hypothetical protein